MDNFYDSFIGKLDDDEIRTIFFTAKQTADTILNRPVCSEFLPKDAESMSLGMAAALEILRRYENSKNLYSPSGTVSFRWRFRFLSLSFQVPN